MRSHRVGTVVYASMFVAMLGGCSLLDGPTGPIPGGRLRAGPLVTEPVVDWSFADSQRIELQLVEPPTSRTVGVWLHEGQLYVPCDLGFIWRRIPAPARWMASLIYRFKRWHEDALRDGRVVLRIASKRYELQAVRVSDPEILAPLRLRFEGWAEKTFSSPLGEVPTDPPNDIWFFRMDPRPSSYTPELADEALDAGDSIKVQATRVAQPSPRIRSTPERLGGQPLG